MLPPKLERAIVERHRPRVDNMLTQLNRPLTAAVRIIFVSDFTWRWQISLGLCVTIDAADCEIVRRAWDSRKPDPFSFSPSALRPIAVIIAADL